MYVTQLNYFVGDIEMTIGGYSKYRILPHPNWLYSWFVLVIFTSTWFSSVKMVVSLVNNIFQNCYPLVTITFGKRGIDRNTFVTTGPMSRPNISWRYFTISKTIVIRHSQLWSVVSDVNTSGHSFKIYFATNSLKILQTRGTWHSVCGTKTGK